MLSRSEYLATLPRRRLAAAALIRDDQGRVCLVEPTYKDRWILPGGTVEADEAPSSACTGEVREELGVDVVPGPLLALSWVAPVPGLDPHGGLRLVYDGGVVGPATIARFVLPTDELRSFRFVAPREVSALATPGTARDVDAALTGLAQGRVVELV
jgi:8-oxo-dGTP diphosphatase